MKKTKWGVALATVAVVAAAVAQGAGEAPAAELKPALVVSHAVQAGQLAVARAGKRLVSVGDHGVILTSDDEGQHWKQADQVPFDGLLNGVSFADEQHGWAVGHAGVILHTADAGRTWTLQRSDTATDRPLFAVQFFDAEHGVAVGLWSLVLVTEDGGKTWAEQKLAPPEGARKADLNLLGLFTNAKGEVFAAAERGTVLRSADRGHTWTYLPTGYTGSFWCGVALPDGTLLAGGLRGSLFRSEDDGSTWQRIETRTTSSITALAVHGEQHVTGVGADGLVLQSNDGGRTFAPQVRDDRRPLTALAPVAGQKTLLLSRGGPLAP
jgi:photosystem II stability/assembly factor-like uncharacterized protein